MAWTKNQHKSFYVSERPGHNTPRDVDSSIAENLFDMFGFARVLVNNVRSLRSLNKKAPTHLLFVDNSYDFIAISELQSSLENLEKNVQLWSKLTRLYRYTVWNPCRCLLRNSGYSGTAAWFRHHPEEIEFGFFGDPSSDMEGRLITVTFKDCAVVSTYHPAVWRESDHDTNTEAQDRFFRAQGNRRTFENKLRQHCSLLFSARKLIFMGDINFTLHDYQMPLHCRDRFGLAAVCPISRATLTTMLIECNLQLTLPQSRSASTYFPEPNMRNQKRNIGMEIDCIFADASLQVVDSQVLSDCTGSDHRPVTAILAKEGATLKPLGSGCDATMVLDPVPAEFREFQGVLSRNYFETPIEPSELEIAYDIELTEEPEPVDNFYNQLYKHSAHANFETTKFFKRHCRAVHASSIYVKVFFGGVARTVMVDTGCSLPLIDPDFLKEHYPAATLTQLDHPIPLIIGDGTQEMKCTHRVTIKIEFETRTGRILNCWQQFFVVDPALHDAVILGHRFFYDQSNYLADLSYVDQCLCFDREEIPWIGQEVPATLTLLVSRKVLLEPHTITAVNVKTFRNEKLMGVFTIHTQYANPMNVSRDGEDSYFGELRHENKVWICNPTSKRRMLRAGAEVGTFISEIPGEIVSVVALFDEDLLYGLVEPAAHISKPITTNASNNLSSPMNSAQATSAHAKLGYTVYTSKGTSDVPSTSLAGNVNASGSLSAGHSANRTSTWVVPNDVISRAGLANPASDPLEDRGRSQDSFTSATGIESSSRAHRFERCMLKTDDVCGRHVTGNTCTVLAPDTIKDASVNALPSLVRDGMKTTLAMSVDPGGVEDAGENVIDGGILRALLNPTRVPLKSKIPKTALRTHKHEDVSTKDQLAAAQRRIPVELWRQILTSNANQRVKAASMTQEELEAFRVTNHNPLLSEATIREVCSMPDADGFDIPDFYDSDGKLDPARLPEYAATFELGLDQVNIDRAMCNRTIFEVLIMNEHIAETLTTSAPGYVSPDYFAFNVELTNTEPWNEHLRPMAPEDKIDLREVIEKNLKLGLIEPCTGPYASRCLLVRKSNGRHQIASCLNTLNSRTRKNSYPLPLIVDNLDVLSSAFPRSSLDISGAYLSIPMPEEYRDMFAFICHFGLYRWTRLPYGFKNAGPIFCALINKVTSGLRFQINVSYSDDLVVTGVSQTVNHIKCINVLLLRIFESGLRISIVKCLLFRMELPYLGFIISDAGVQPSPDNTSKLVKLKIRDVKVLRSFLGMSGYYRRFIKGYSQIVLPLRNLVAGVVRKSDFDREDIVAAIKEIRDCLLSKPILCHPNFTKTFYLYTDASRKGFGFALMQMQGTLLHTVRYGSCGLPKLKSLNVKDSNLLEIAAAAWAVNKNRVYLSRDKFILRTDAQIMKYLNKRDLSDAVMSYVVILNSFTFDVQTIAGATNHSADLMSRDGNLDDDDVEMEEMNERYFLNTVALTKEAIEPNEVIEELSTPSPPDLDTLAGSEALILSFEMWLLHQSEDPIVSSIIAQLAGIETEPPSKYIMSNGLLFRKPAEGKTRLRVYVPESLKALVVTNAHLYLGHRGMDTSLKILCSRTYFPDMVAYIRAKLKTCVECARRRPNFSKKQGLTRRVVAMSPMQWLCIDFMGPLPRSKEGFRYIFVVVDVFSRYPWAIPMAEPTPDLVAQALLNNVFCFFGLPQGIHSDNGSNLTDAALTAIFRALGVRRTTTTVANPNGNSPVERFNRFIDEHITIELKAYDEWPKHLPSLVFAYRCVPSSLGYSPCFLMTGLEPILPLDVSLFPTSEQMQRAEPECDDVDSYVFELNSRLRVAFDKVRDLQERRSKSHAERRDEDQKRVAIAFVAGEVVALYEHASVLNRVDYTRRGIYDKTLVHARRKWQFNFTGPHVILSGTQNPNIYTIRHNVRGDITVNVHHLKPWPPNSPDGYMTEGKRFKPPFCDLPMPYTEVQKGELVVIYVPEAAGRCRVAKVLMVEGESITVHWYGYFGHAKKLDNVLAQHKWEPLWVDSNDGQTYSKAHALHPSHSEHTNTDFPIIPLTCKDILLRNVCLKSDGKIPSKQAESALANLTAAVRERGHENYHPPQAAEIFMSFDWDGLAKLIRI